MRGYIDACDAIREIHDLTLIVHDYLSKGGILDAERKSVLCFLTGIVLKRSAEALAATEGEG